MSFLKEFKEFALKGNLIDMAIAFVMGAAFSTLSTKLINGIVMPVIGQITAGAAFDSLKYVMSEEIVDATGKVIAAESAIKYGEFITACINFLVIAFVMFLIVKAMNKLKKAEILPPPEPTVDQKLLTEIRDSLQRKP